MCAVLLCLVLLVLLVLLALQVLLAQGGRGKAVVAFEQTDEVRLVGESAGTTDVLYRDIAINYHQSCNLHLLYCEPAVGSGAKGGHKVTLEGRRTLVAGASQVANRWVGE